MPRQVGHRAAVATVHARGGPITERTGDRATARVGGDDEPRGVEGDVFERELDRRRAQRANIERVHRACTYTCTSVRYLTASPSPRSAQSQFQIIDDTGRLAPR